MNDRESSAAESFSSLIDRLANRFEREWRDGKLPRIEDYLDEVNDEYRDLLAEELEAVALQLQAEVESAKLADTVSFEQPTKQKDSQKDHPTTIGRYRVDVHLGGGGFGDVYKAWDDVLHRYVAIKVPRRDRAVAPEDVEQFLREARLLASLDHPNIVPVHDFGLLEDGSCFVVSKVVEGTNLTKRIKEDRPSNAESADIIAAVSRAIHYAHTQGLYHRDIKPENILLDTTGRPYVSDFGLALRSEEISFGPAFAGTAYYMSPEQAGAQADMVDGRTDVFALGVVLYELLTGVRPFVGESLNEVAQRILKQEARPPRQINDSIPVELERICLKALAKKLSERFTTALDLALEIEEFLSADSAVDVSASPGIQLDLKLGRYRLQFSLGMGAFGNIYQAIDTATGSTVVLKEQRFSEEAEAAKLCEAWGEVPALRHPNIVATLDVSHEDEVVIIVQEYAEGNTLTTWGSERQCSERGAAELCCIVARALHYAHSKGIVHGDLKPNHIVIDDAGKPHILNLPWVCLFISEGAIVGTPSYVSPEQAKRKPATFQSDVYSIGVILFQLLTGVLPFRGPGMKELLQQVTDEEPVRPRSIDSRISADLEAICLRCLEKDPKDRYDTANDLATDLQRFLNGEPIEGTGKSISKSLIDYLYVDQKRLDNYVSQVSPGREGEAASTHSRATQFFRWLGDHDLAVEYRPSATFELDAEKFFCETMIARRAVIYSKNYWGRRKDPELAIWVSTEPEPDAVRTEEFPAGKLLLLEDYDGKDIVIRRSSFSGLMLLAVSTGGMSRGIPFGNPNSAKASRQFAEDPIGLLKKLGAEFGAEQRVKATYRVRAVCAEQCRDRFTVTTIGYPIVIESA